MDRGTIRALLEENFLRHALSLEAPMNYPNQALAPEARKKLAQGEASDRGPRHQGSQLARFWQDGMAVRAIFACWGGKAKPEPWESV
jgi:hypothetical protein